MAFYPAAEFCPAIAGLLSHSDAHKSKFGKPEFRESLSPDDIAKPHLENLIYM